MSKNVIQALPELVHAGVISPETADSIRAYYHQPQQRSTQLLVLVSAILGALLVGLGLILILAHNWDELARSTKTGLAFLPLLLGQGLCAFALWKSPPRPALREGAATFLLLALGASIALVSQIYHIPGDLGPFLLTWMLLSLPLVYLLASSMASLLYLVGITWYALTKIDAFYGQENYFVYWLLLAGILPYYYRLYRQRPAGNFTVFHHWLVPLSAGMGLFTQIDQKAEFLFPAFFSLFSLYRMLGFSGQLNKLKTGQNGYLVLGTAGLVGLLLAFSFDAVWAEFLDENWDFPAVLTRQDFIAAGLITGLALAVLGLRYRRDPGRQVDLLEAGFLFFLLAMGLGLLRVSAAVVFVNLLVLGLGVLTIRRGARSGSMPVMNFGLLLVAALVVCRFFDTDLSFVVRGLLFVLVGLGFFLANYWMLRKRKTHEQ
ncbi:MAG: DUF2157 domain-containing protein [Adhaeribacter sp.]